MTTILAYSMPVAMTVFTSLPGVGTNMQYGTHQNRAEFKVFRGVQNSIEVLIRDIDRKPVVIAPGSDVYMTISEVKSKKSLLRLPLSLIDAPQGWYRLVLTANQADAFDVGSYRHVLTVVTGANEVMLFTDQNYGTHGFVYVVEGPAAPPVPPLVVKTRDFMPSDGFLRGGPWRSENIATVGISLTNFIGQFTIETTDLEVAPTQDRGWEPLTTFETLQAMQGQQNISLTAPMRWIRFRIKTYLGEIETVTLSYS